MKRLLLIASMTLLLGSCGTGGTETSTLSPKIKVTHPENGQDKTYELQEYSESGAIGVGLF